MKNVLSKLLSFLLSFSLFQTVFVLEDLHPPKPAKKQISYATYQAEFAKRKALLKQLENKKSGNRTKVSQLQAQSSDSEQLSE